MIYKGLSLYRDDPTEVNKPVNFNVTAASGFDSAIDIVVNFGHPKLDNKLISLFNSTKWFGFQRVYDKSGFYNVTLTATHYINNETYSCQVFC